MSPGEQIAFQPSLTHVLTEHLQHTALMREMFVDRKRRFHPLLVGNLIESLQAVRGRFIRAENAEVL